MTIPTFGRRSCSWVIRIDVVVTLRVTPIHHAGRDDYNRAAFVLVGDPD